MDARRTFLTRLLAVGALPLLTPAAPASAQSRDDDVVLMLASERMLDPRFRNTVLLVMRHGPGGPLGVILNRPTRIPRGAALPGIDSLPDKRQPVYYGGPVSPNTLYYIGRFSAPPPQVLTLAPGLYMGLNIARLAAMLDAGERPQALRIYAGYAGWAPGQLQSEIAHQSWHVLPLDTAAVFDEQPADLYRRLYDRTRLIPA